MNMVKKNWLMLILIFLLLPVIVKGTATIEQSFTTGNGVGIAWTSNNYVGMVFNTTESYLINTISVNFFTINGNPTGTMCMGIWNATGNDLNIAEPRALSYCTDCIDTSLVGEDEWWNFTGCNFQTEAMNSYSIMAVNHSHDESNRFLFKGDSGSGYLQGKVVTSTDGSSWTPAQDLWFILYNDPPVTSLSSTISYPTDNQHIGDQFEINGTCTNSDDTISHTWIYDQYFKPTNFPTVNNSLVSWWRMEGDALDEMGANNGTVTGATPATGYLGRGYSFDGVDDLIDIGNDASLNIIGNITISTWIKINVLGTNYGIVGKLKIFDTAALTQYHLSIATDNNLYFQISDGTTKEYANIAHGFSINTWNHVVSTWNGTHIQIYINGQLKKTQASTINSMQSTANNAWIGRSPDSVSFPFNGTIDEVRIYNRALNQTEITAQYNSKHWNTDSGNTTHFNFKNMSEIEAGEYSLTIMCNDTSGNSANDTVNFVVDLTKPFINDNSGLSGENVYNRTSNLSISIGFDYLYMIHTNVTCENGTQLISDANLFDGSYQQFTLSNTTNNYLCGDSSIINVTVQVADTHTNNKIKDMPHTKIDKELRFNPGTTKEIKIYPKNKNSFESVDTEKHNDRYTFTYKRSGYLDKYYDEFYLEGNNIQQITEGNYKDKGHFVIWRGFGGASNWVDFATDENYPVTITKDNDKKYVVKVDCSKDGCTRDYKFKSIGGLNENSISFTYYYDGSNITTTETYDDNINEGETISLALNISYNTLKYSSLDEVLLIWNNTNYPGILSSATNTSLSNNFSYYSANVAVPTATGINGSSIFHKWSYNLSFYNGSSVSYSTVEQNQTVIEYIFDNCSIGLFSAITFYIYNETEQTNLSADDFDIFVSYQLSTGHNKNFSYNLGSSEHYNFCIAPNNAVYTNVDIEVRYERAGFGTRYYISNDQTINNQTQNISLYMLPTADRTDITINIVDEYDEPLQGYIVEAYKYDTGTNSYIFVGAKQTNVNGISVFDLDVTYEHSFVVKKESTTVYTATKMQLTETEYTFRITSELPPNIIFDLGKLDYSIIWGGPTGIVAFLNYSDYNFNVVDQVCLKVTKHNITNHNILVNNCSTADINVLTYGIDNQSGQYVASVYVISSSDGKEYYVDSATLENIVEEWTLFDASVLIGVILFMGTLFMIGLTQSVELAFILLAVGFIVFWKLGFVMISLSALMGFIVMLGVKMWVIKKE